MAPVRRVEIPKPDGGTRPLSVAALEDKIVQKAVTEIMLTLTGTTKLWSVSFLVCQCGIKTAITSAATIRSTGLCPSRFMA